MERVTVLGGGGGTQCKQEEGEKKSLVEGGEGGR